MVTYPPPQDLRSPCPQPPLLAWLLADPLLPLAAALPPLQAGPSHWLWDPWLHSPSWRKPQASLPSLHDR